jgi:hypothetical protein
MDFGMPIYGMKISFYLGMHRDVVHANLACTTTLWQCAFQFGHNNPMLCMPIWHAQQPSTPRLEKNSITHPQDDISIVFCILYILLVENGIFMVVWFIYTLF